MGFILGNVILAEQCNIGILPIQALNNAKACIQIYVHMLFKVYSLAENKTRILAQIYLASI